MSVNKWAQIIAFAFIASVMLVIHHRDISELRKDVNRVSNIQIRCAHKISEGIYAPDMWDQCMDDYITSLYRNEDLTSR